MKPPVTATVVPPGRIGVVPCGAAMAAAIPRRSSLRTLEIEVDKLEIEFEKLLKAPFNWLTLTASVPNVPGATLVICRSPPGTPTDTVLGRVAIEPWPSATELGALAMARSPKAVVLKADATAALPIATDKFPEAVEA